MRFFGNRPVCEIKAGPRRLDRNGTHDGRKEDMVAGDDRGTPALAGHVTSPDDVVGWTPRIGKVWMILAHTGLASPELWPVFTNEGSHCHHEEANRKNEPTKSGNMHVHAVLV